MAYNVFGGMLSLTQSIYRRHHCQVNIILGFDTDGHLFGSVTVSVHHSLQFSRWMTDQTCSQALKIG